MANSKPKISVVIITYNQEKLIGRALDSILCQKDYVHEIIVADDCSIDRNWDVISEYKRQFPSIVKPYQNEHNLGIFGNMESTWGKVEGDIVFLLAGDDMFCDKIFEKTYEIVFRNKIDFESESFLILFDFMVKNTNGDERIISNSLINKHNSLSLKIRNLIYNRSMGVSLSVIKKHISVKKEIGVCAEGLIDIQSHLFSDKAYYMPYVGSVYFSNIGITTRLNRHEHIISYIRYYDVLRKMIEDTNQLTKEDTKWIIYSKSKFVFLNYPCFSNLLKYFFGLIRNSKIKYGFSFLKREYKVFVLNFLRI